MKSKSMKSAVKILLLVAMICFFFPFALVSCSGESVEASGFELMTTISLSGDIEFDETDTPNYYLGIAFVFGIIGLACAWNASKDNKKMLAAGACSIGGAVFLLVFRSTFWGFYELMGYEGRVTVEFRWGWVLSLIAYVTAAGGAFLCQFMDSISTLSFTQNRPPYEPNVSNTPDYGLVSSIVSAPETIPAGTATGRLNDDYSASSCSGQDDAPEAMPLTMVVRITMNGKTQTISVMDFPCLIGRDGASCDVKVEDSKASRIHAQLNACDDGIYIEDMGSSNGTMVNGERISNPTEILSGDEVLVGSTHITFEIACTDLEDCQ